MSSVRTRFLAVLATLTCCFRSDEREREHDSHKTDSTEDVRDTLFSRIGGGDNSIQYRQHENTGQRGPTDEMWNMSGEQLGCSDTEEQKSEGKNSNKNSNFVKLQNTDGSSTSSEERLCFCEGCKMGRIHKKHPRIKQVLEIEGDDRRLRDFDHIQSLIPAQDGPDVDERERCIKSARMVRRASEEAQLDIPTRPHTAEELHRRLCRQLRKAEQRRRQKSKRPGTAIPTQKSPQHSSEKSSVKEAELYVPVSRPPTPIPCGGNCLDDKLLFKRKMSEKVAEIIFEVGEEDEDKEFTFAKFSPLRQSRASKRWPRGITVRCRSLSSIHVIRLYASPVERDTTITETYLVQEPGRRGTWPIAGKQPDWPTGRTVLHEANKQRKDVHRRASKKLSRKAKIKN